MVANKVFEDPRGVNTVFCYTNSAIDLDSIITINGTPARISKVYTSAEGWNPSPGSSNQGVIGFNYLGSAYSFGDTFVIESSAGNTTISDYGPGAGYGYLNFFGSTNQAYDPGSYLYKAGEYLNVGSGDFTIEFVFRLNALGVQGATYINFINTTDFGTQTSFWVMSYNDVMAYSRSGGNVISFGLNVEDTDWHHFAVSRSSGTLYPYLDGVQGTLRTETTNFANFLSCFIGGNNLFGAYGINEIYGLDGNISNIRVTVNEALYTESSFVPPTLPLSAGPNTTLLLLPVDEATQYVNSVDSESFICHNNPITNQAVTFSAGPIPYPPPPPPPPNLAVFWDPLSTQITWYEGWNGGGPYHSYLNCVDFNETNPSISNFSQVKGFSFNFANNIVTSLTGLELLTELQYFTISDTYLSNLVLSGNSKLTKIDFNNVPLTSIDLTNNLFLSSIDIQGSPLTEINLNNNTGLTRLNIGGSQLKTIDLSNLTQLPNFGITSCPLTSVQGLQNLDSVNYFYLTNNSLSTIDINNMSSLQYAYLNNNSISSLTLTSCPGIIWLDLYSNSFTQFPDISNVTALEILTLNSNQLTEVNTSYSHTTLRHLNVGFNYSLSSVNLQKFPALKRIFASYCSLTELDVSFMNMSENIYCNNNNLTSLSLPVSTSNSLSNSINTDVIIGDNSSLTTVSLSGIRTIYSFTANYCNFSTSVIDRIFNEISNNVNITNKTNGYVYMSYGSMGSVSSASLTARNNLVSKGWSLYYNA